MLAPAHTNASLMARRRAALPHGLGQGFNFFSPSAGIRGLTMARIVSRYFEKLVGHDATLRIARDSARSLSGVPVPWALM